MKYLSIDGDLLANKSIGGTDKLIISFIWNLQKGNKSFYGTHIYLADVLGIRYEFLEKRFQKLLQVNLLHTTPNGIELTYSISETAEKDWKLA